MKKLWDVLGELHLTFWLLLSITGLFLIGVYYSINHYSLIQALDTTPVQVWLQDAFVQQPGLTWWVPVLLILLTLLGINTFVCVCNRVRNLWPRRRTLSGNAFVVALCPSLIHGLFLVVLTGHLLTITASSHEKIPIRPGTAVRLTEQQEVVIQGIDLEKYPEHSLLRDRTRQVHVSVAVSDGESSETRSVRFLKPLLVGKTYLHLDLERKPVPERTSADDSTVCNRSEFSLAQHEPQVFLVITRDPGFSVIVWGFCGIVLLLLWYYIHSRRYSWFKGKDGLEFRKGDREAA